MIKLINLTKAHLTLSPAGVPPLAIPAESHVELQDAAYLPYARQASVFVASKHLEVRQDTPIAQDITPEPAPVEPAPVEPAPVAKKAPPTTAKKPSTTTGESK